MKITQTGFSGLLIVELKYFEDDRGFFCETYNKRTFGQHGIDFDFVQDNHAYSKTRGVLRGLHFQTPDMAQAKMVWVTKGNVLDTVVDIRKGSPTYGQHYSIELSADNRKRFVVPKGFAHGYLTLTDDVEFMYKVDNYYSAKNDAGIAWNDPDLGIAWPVDEPILSEKDRNHPCLKDYDSPFVFGG